MTAAERAKADSEKFKQKMAEQAENKQKAADTSGKTDAGNYTTSQYVKDNGAIDPKTEEEALGWKIINSLLKKTGKSVIKASDDLSDLIEAVPELLKSPKDPGVLKEFKDDAIGFMKKVFQDVTKIESIDLNNKKLVGKPFKFPKTTGALAQGIALDYVFMCIDGDITAKEIIKGTVSTIAGLGAGAVSGGLLTLPASMLASEIVDKGFEKLEKAAETNAVANAFNNVLESASLDFGQLFTVLPNEKGRKLLMEGINEKFNPMTDKDTAWLTFLSPTLGITAKFIKSTVEAISETASGANTPQSSTPQNTTPNTTYTLPDISNSCAPTSVNLNSVQLTGVDPTSTFWHL